MNPRTWYEYDMNSTWVGTWICAFRIGSRFFTHSITQEPSQTHLETQQEQRTHG